MIIAPHARFAAGHLASRRNVVPTIGAMVDAVENQTLVLRIRAQVRLVEQRVKNGHPGLPVPFAVLAEVMAEPEQTLSGDCGGRTIYRLELIERFRGSVEIITESMQLRRSRVPVRDAVGRAVCNVEITGCARRSFEQCPMSLLPDGVEEFQLLREPAHRPGQSPRP